jgi:dienelactone hydrolase
VAWDVIKAGGFHLNLRGQEDAADVPCMVEFLASQLPGPSPRIIVIGYSYGACLASYALKNNPRVALYIGVSFPMGGLSAVLQTKAGFDILCGATSVPRLLVLGSQDQYTKLAVMEAAVAAGGGVRVEEGSNSLAGATAGSEGSEKAGATPLLLKVFPENGHFWERDCALMVEYCVGYAQQVLL